MVDHDSIINSREQYMEYLPIHKYKSVFVYGILKLFVQFRSIFTQCDSFDCWAL